MLCYKVKGNKISILPPPLSLLCLVLLTLIVCLPRSCNVTYVENNEAPNSDFLATMIPSPVAWHKYGLSQKCGACSNLPAKLVSLNQAKLCSTVTLAQSENEIGRASCRERVLRLV